MAAALAAKSASSRHIWSSRGNSRNNLPAAHISSCRRSRQLKSVFVLAGDSAVGKSNLVRRFTKNTFDLNSTTTIGLEFGSRKIELDDKIIWAQIWDTAGQERYQSVGKAYYRTAVGALLVYDITNYKSFASIRRWLEDIAGNSDQDVVITLAGNKCDLVEQRAVPVSEAAQFAEDHNILFFETSALDATNVDLAFHSMLLEIYRRTQQREMEDSLLDDRKSSIIVPNATSKPRMPCCKS